MRIKYTFHAKLMIKERKMEKVWIDETIKSPDIVKKEEGKYYVRKKLNGFIIEVVYTKERYINVLTVYWI